MSVGEAKEEGLCLMVIAALSNVESDWSDHICAVFVSRKINLELTCCDAVDGERVGLFCEANIQWESGAHVGSGAIWVMNETKGKKFF